mgnify:CR=1 FL=1|jgi:hypothetical protein
MTEKIGQTDTEKWAKESLVNRQIVDQILKFGVNQRQILNIINLLAIELENREALLAIVSAVKEALEEAQVSQKVITVE